jgi:hypothetical protein
MRAVCALEQTALDTASNWKLKVNQERKPKAPRPSFNHVCAFCRFLCNPSIPFQEFIPFLQTYFEYNAFPSAADRVEMAKKSMMEPRQIEVWVRGPPSLSATV